MAKCCKVIAASIGPRRGSPHNAEGVKQCLDEQIKHACGIDPGMDVDVYIVNHSIKGVEHVEYLQSLAETSTPYGKVHAVNRDWNSGRGLSWESYSTVIDSFLDKYEYWYFVEDDVLPVSSNYIADMVSILDGNDDVGFVALSVIAGHPYTLDSAGCITHTGTAGLPIHAHGSNGLTSRAHIQQVLSKFGKMAYPSMPYVGPTDRQWMRDAELNGEVAFSNAFVSCGYKIAKGLDSGHWSIQRGEYV